MIRIRNPSASQDSPPTTPRYVIMILWVAVSDGLLFVRGWDEEKLRLGKFISELAPEISVNRSSLSLWR